MDSTTKTDAPTLQGLVSREALIERCRTQLAAAQNELASVMGELEMLEFQKEKFEEKRIRLEGKIEGLGPICHEVWKEEENKQAATWAEWMRQGIQECCYQALVEANCALSASMIRDMLQERGVDMDRYSNPLAVIHTSLRRMPDRVRAFRKTERTGNRRASVRYYEVLK